MSNYNAPDNDSVNSEALDYTAPNNNSVNGSPVDLIFENEWKYRKEITLDSGKIDGDLTDWPLTFHTTDSDLSDNAQSSGDDIVFALEDGTQLSHEIESYDSSTGELWAHVKLPSVSASSDTTLFLYYGNDSASNQEYVADVWSNGFEGVWHLDEDGTADRTDSTANNNTAVPQNYDGDEAVTGQIGGGDNTDDTSDWLKVADDESLDITDAVTMSAWLEFDSVASDYYRFLQKGQNDAYEVYTSSGGTAQTIRINGGLNLSGSSIGTGNRTQVVATHDTNESALYYNGSVEATGGSQGTLNTNTAPLRIGSREQLDTTIDGLIDEVRLSSVSRSDAWVSTTYTNQSDPQSFYNIGSETSHSYFSLDNPETSHSYFSLDNPELSDATLVGAKTTETAISGDAVYLDGEDDYISLTNEPHNFTGEFTLSMWLKPHRDIHSEGKFVGFLSKWPGGDGYQLFWHDAGYIYLYFSGGIAVSTKTTFTEMPAGQWYHLACVGKPETDDSRIYVNGIDVSDKQTYRDTPGTNTEPLTVGTRPDKLGSFNLPATIDEIKTFDTALSGEQITQLYHSNAPDQTAKYYGSDVYGQSVYGGSTVITESAGVDVTSSASGAVHTTAVTTSATTQQTQAAITTTTNAQGQPEKTTSTSATTTATTNAQTSLNLSTSPTSITTDIGRGIYSATTQPTIFPTDAEAHYPLDNVTDTNVTDASGNGHTGVATESVVSAPGVVGSSAKFTNTSAEVEIDYNSSSEVIFEDWTVSGWIKLSDWASQSRKEWVSISEDQSNTKPLNFVHENGKLKHYRGAAAGSVLSYDVQSLTGWHHVAVRQRRQDSSTVAVEMLVDGTQVDSTVGNYENMRPSLKFTLGNIVDGRFDWVDYLDEVRLYSRFLSDTEVQALYNIPSGSTTNAPSLTATTQITAQPTTEATPTATAVTGLSSQPTPTSTTTAGEASQTLATSNTLAVTADSILTERTTLITSLTPDSGTRTAATTTETGSQVASALPNTQGIASSSQSPQSLSTSTITDTQSTTHATELITHPQRATFETTIAGSVESSLQATPFVQFTTTASSTGHPKILSKSVTPMVYVSETNLLRAAPEPLSAIPTIARARTKTVATDGGTQTSQATQQTREFSNTIATATAQNTTQLLTNGDTIADEQQTTVGLHSSTTNSIGFCKATVLSQRSSSVVGTDATAATISGNNINQITFTVASELTPSATAETVLSQNNNNSMRVSPYGSAITAVTDVINETQITSTDTGRVQSQPTTAATATESNQEHSSSIERVQSNNSAEETTTETGVGRVDPRTTNTNTSSFPDDPLAYYPLDSVSSGTITDASGNELNGTHKPGVESITGVGGTAGAFYDGSTESVIEDYDKLDNLGGFALSVWFKPNDNEDQSQTIIGTAPEFELIFDGPGGRTPNERSVWWAIDNGTGDWSVNSPAMPPLALDTWHHALLQQASDSNAVELWVNGEQYASDTGIGIINDSANPLKIGARGGKSFDTFTGGVDEVRIYSRSLSESEVTALYENPTKPASNGKQEIFGATGISTHSATTQTIAESSTTVESVPTTTASATSLSTDTALLTDSATPLVLDTTAAQISVQKRIPPITNTTSTAVAQEQQQLPKQTQSPLIDNTNATEHTTFNAIPTTTTTSFSAAHASSTKTESVTLYTNDRAPITPTTSVLPTTQARSSAQTTANSRASSKTTFNTQTGSTARSKISPTATTNTSVVGSDTSSATAALLTTATHSKQLPVVTTGLEKPLSTVGFTTLATITADGSVVERTTTAAQPQFTNRSQTSSTDNAMSTISSPASLTDTTPVIEAPNQIAGILSQTKLTHTANGISRALTTTQHRATSKDSTHAQSTSIFTDSLQQKTTDTATAREHQQNTRTFGLTTTPTSAATVTQVDVDNTISTVVTNDRAPVAVTTSLTIADTQATRAVGSSTEQQLTTHYAQPTTTPRGIAHTTATVHKNTTTSSIHRTSGRIVTTTTQQPQTDIVERSKATSTINTIRPHMFRTRALGRANSTVSPAGVSSTWSTAESALGRPMLQLETRLRTRADHIIPGLLRRVSLTDVLDTAVGTDDTPLLIPELTIDNADAELTRTATQISVKRKERTVVVLDPDN